MSEQGVKFDQDKSRIGLMPPSFIKGVSDVLTFGAKKYDDRNWENGIEFERVFSALQRHLWAWWNGEDNDPETGMSHIYHAGCNLAFLSEYMEREMKELDNRPKAAK